jgi:hypothetical protein
MKRLLGPVFATAILLVPGGPARADEKDANAILDKAIAAMGGEEKLAKATAYTWKFKGTVTFNGEERESNGLFTAKGLDHYRREFGNDQFSGVFVLADTKGWRKFGDNTNDMDDDAIANEKRNLYLQVIPTTLVPVKVKGFKYETAGEEKVGDKPAAILKITGPDGKDFRLSFDKETGLPVKLVANVVGFQGQEYTSETTFADYKDFGGIKKATKVVVKRDGEPFQTLEITEFKLLDKVDAETFTEPK